MRKEMAGLFHPLKAMCLPFSELHRRRTTSPRAPLCRCQPPSRDPCDPRAHHAPAT